WAFPGAHHGATEVVAPAATSLSDITEAENGAGDRRRTRESPCHAAVAGNHSACVIGITGTQIATAHDPVVRIATINGECDYAGRAKQRRIIRVPGVPLICGS